MKLDMANLLRRSQRGVFYAPDDRIAVEVYGRKQPVAYRTAAEAEPQLPQDLQEMPSKIVASLPFSALPRDATVDTMFNTFDATIDRLREMFADAARFVAAVFSANIEVRGKAWLSDRRKFDLMQKKMDEWKDRLPRFELQPRAVLTLDLYAKPPFVVRPTLDMAQADVAHTLARELFLGFDHLVNIEQCGVIEWTSDRACRLHSFRNVVMADVSPDRVHTTRTDTAVSRTTHTRTERDVEVTHSHARIVEELIQATNFTLDGAVGIPVPQRVATLLGLVPAWLRPFMRFVTGTQIRLMTIERDLSVEKTTEVEESVRVTELPVYRYDPAICLAFYVLTAFDQAELDAEHADAPKQLPPSRVRAAGTPRPPTEVTPMFREPPPVSQPELITDPPPPEESMKPTIILRATLEKKRNPLLLMAGTATAFLTMLLIVVTAAIKAETWNWVAASGAILTAAGCVASSIGCYGAFEKD